MKNMKHVKTFEKYSEEKGRVSDLPEFKLIKMIDSLKSEIEKGNKEEALKILGTLDKAYRKSANIA